jgi:RNA methyltransferase, TrmH family
MRVRGCPRSTAKTRYGGRVAYDFLSIMKRTSVDSEAQNRLRRVEGRHNKVLKDLRRAFVRAELTVDGHCAIEGLRIVEEAIRSGVRFKSLFLSESAIAVANRLLPQIGSHTDALLIPEKLFRSIVPSETPQGVAALVRWKEFSLDDLIAKASSTPILVAAGLQDPGNLGTILRSAEAFGAAGLIMGEGTVSAFNSKLVRASAGSIFRVPLARAQIAGVIEQLRENGFGICATSARKGTPLPEAELPDRVAIFIGNEGAGLPRDLLGQMDEVVVIPHSNKVESLNAGVAASIVLYEIMRRQLGS